MPNWADATALIVVDVQKGFDDAEYFGDRNNPSCESNIAALLDAWASQSWPVVYVRHDSAQPRSPLHPNKPTNGFKPMLERHKPDLVVVKSTHSAFYGDPDLDAWLRDNDVASIAICGIQTNVCCETTARMASDLGYETLFIIDATHTFDIHPVDGQTMRAREIARTTALTLNEEFARVVYTSELTE
jgi:nicotinamidase-related amidase